MKSPVPGCSILTTSAPCSPSSPAQNGAAMRVPRSSTRTPESGDPGMVLNLRRGAFGGRRLSRHPEHALAQDVALDLVGAGPDRRRLVVEPRPLPGAVARVAVGTVPERRGGAE